MTGAELRAVRNQLGFSGPRLAAALGVRADTIRKWETDRDPIPYRLPENLRAVAAEQIPVLETLIAELDGMCS